MESPEFSCVRDSCDLENCPLPGYFKYGTETAISGASDQRLEQLKKVKWDCAEGGVM
jgi:hypothetical protein